ncbi:LIM zinc-binding domain-containing Nebulette-like isoform X2 [Saccostrea echinata]|uniref:LIM zinc-binding domain-containing Nebulette-like isoform X2 n=1 Tax=Saccostrea echinata TaxID=191078 RepID=UPI002A81E338|nr:LIM zinc-binding domain-containing Nebulette-like isoform X2 [Saccostrea echinata]
MSKKCAKCEKTVYPTEELKCLDKFWHKACFKCDVCNMTLNMKNYKGYNKIPYCNVHYPTTSFTAVADTPENQRIKQNTKVQSNVQYHSEFEKQKGAYTQVADTPDMLRHQQNTKNISLIEYHRNFEESKSQFTCVTDTPVMKTQLTNTKNVSLIEYHRDFEKSKSKYTQVADSPEIQKYLENTKNISLVQYQKDFTESKGSCYQVPDTVEMLTHRRNTENVSRIKYHADFEKMKGKKLTVVDDPETMRIKQNTAIQSQVEYHKVKDQLNEMEIRRPDREAREGPARPQPGKISNYEPETNTGGTPYSMRNSQARVVYDSNIGKVEDVPTRRVGSISDYDPMNNQFGSIGRYSGGDPEPPRGYQAPPPQSYQPPPPQPAMPPPSEGMVCKALYDYTSADVDEVSFQEDDLIIQCQPIDEGWMEGTVKRTGQRGMLPSNYVEPVN